MFTLLASLIFTVHAEHPFEACRLTVVTSNQGVARPASAPFTVEFDEAGAVTYRARVGTVVARMFNNRGRALDYASAPSLEPRVWFSKDAREFFAIQILDGDLPVQARAFDHRLFHDVATEEAAFARMRASAPDLRLFAGPLDVDGDGAYRPANAPTGRMAFIDCLTNPLQ